MGTKNNQKKQGATSYYMIIVSALLFGVIAAGFITLMVNEMSKSSENNLSQSAYDSAVVGIEDTKILLKKYNEIKDYMAQHGGAYPDNIVNAKDFVDAVDDSLATEENESQCINFAELGYAQDYDGGVLVQETDEKGITVQSYTCIMIDFYPKDYLSTLSSESPTRIIPLQTRNDENDKIKNVRISWYSPDNLAGQGTANFANTDDAAIISFSDDASNPPVLVAQLYQTSTNFNYDSFSTSGPDKNNPTATDRGTLWLVPANTNSYPAVLSGNVHYEQWGDPTKTKPSDRSTILSNNAFLNSNDHREQDSSGQKITHTGYPVSCANAPGNLDYLCSVVIELPNPVNGSRSNVPGTFLLSLTMPYGQPTTDIRVEMSSKNISETWESDGSYIGDSFDKVQTIIDSTGRANDVYQRVESRIETFNSDFPFPDYTLTLGQGDGEGASLWKNFIISSDSGCKNYSIEDESPIENPCP